MAAAIKPPATRLIERYENVAQISRAMRLAVTNGDLGRFESLFHECRDEIDGLRSAADPQSLRQDERLRRIQLLREILADDAEIRRCADAGYKRIDAWLSGARDR